MLIYVILVGSRELGDGSCWLRLKLFAAIARLTASFGQAASLMVISYKHQVLNTKFVI
jgi:hypothetical protein